MTTKRDTLLAVYWPLLRAITKIKDKRCQQKILRHLKKDKNFVAVLREISINTIKQNVALTEKDKRKLNRYSSVIRSLTKSRSVEQAGGFLGTIVPILASIVLDLVSLLHDSRVTREEQRSTQ